MCASPRARALFEGMASVRHADLRRAVLRCVCRAKTWPMLVAHDRGKEFANALMEELRGLLNIDARLGTAWRPVDQAPVERVHRESQKEIGIFLHEVFKCAPGHWGELLPLAEFALWNSPGKSGLSPRDLVMGWSLASPLERELAPFDLPACEAISDVAAAQFEGFRRMREKQLALRAADGRVLLPGG